MLNGLVFCRFRLIFPILVLLTMYGILPYSSYLEKRGYGNSTTSASTT